MAFSREYSILVDLEKLADYSILAVLQLRFVGSNPTPRTSLELESENDVYNLGYTLSLSEFIK